MDQLLPPPADDAAAWAAFAAAFAAFLLSHAVPARPAVRRRLVAVLGGRGCLAASAIVSVAALAWLIAAAGWAPFVPVWSFAPWQVGAPPADARGRDLAAEPPAGVRVGARLARS